MYLFSRSVTLRGNPRDTVPFAKDVCALVNERTSFEVSLWQALFGAPVGSFGFSALIDSRAAFLADQAQLLEDDDYLDLVDRGEDFLVAPAEDRLVEIVHSGGGELQRAGVGAAVTITTALAEVGHTSEAIGWSIAMTDLVAQIIGVPVHLGSVQHGAIGELQWTGTVADITEADRTSELLAKDEDYLGQLDRADGLFVPGSGRQMLGVRIA